MSTCDGIRRFLANLPAAGVPQEVVNTLAQASEKVVKSKEFVEAIEKTGSVVDFVTPAEYLKSLEDQ